MKMHITTKKIIFNSQKKNILIKYISIHLKYIYIYKNMKSFFKVDFMHFHKDPDA